MKFHFVTLLRFTICLALCLAAWPGAPAAAAAPQDPQDLANAWNAIGAGLNNGELGDALFYNGRLVVVGSFTDAGGNPAADAVATWDGSAWQPLGSGLPANATSAALAWPFLYVGGVFTNVGGPAGDYIMAWTGNFWTSVGNGLPGPVRSLALYGDQLYAGINQAPWLYKYSNGTWYIVPGFNGNINKMVVEGGNLYIAGDFTDAGGNPNADRVARYNGATWDAIGTGISNGMLLSLAVAGSRVFVGGEFLNANGNPALDNFAYWDGSAWQSLGAGLDGVVGAIAVVGSNVFIGGPFSSAGGKPATQSIAHWDGQQWNSVDGGLSLGNRIFVLLPVGPDLYVGGNFQNAGGLAAADRIARWDGRELSPAWNPVGGGLNGAVQAMLQVGPDLYLGGGFTDAGGNPDNDRITRWDGQTFQPLWHGISNGAVRAMASDGQDLYVAGNFTNAGGNPNADYIARWDGTGWWQVGDGLDTAVNALVFFGPDLYIGGAFTASGGNPNLNHIARLSGLTWQPVGGGLNDTVYALAAWGRELAVGGQFTGATDGGANYLRTWNGAIWNAVSPLPPTGGWVNALAVSGDSLFVGGNFTGIGDITSLGRLARYDAFGGGSWTGSGLDNGYILSLSAYGNRVAAGGSFTVPGFFFDDSNVILWNGSSWGFYGAGVNGITNAVLVSGSDVYAGGYFTDAGGRNYADRIARYGTPITFNYLPILRRP